jgi:hypothetical protein
VSDYEWTDADVLDAKRRAALKQMESRAADVAACEIEEAFWEKKLWTKFPELEHRTHDQYGGLIAFRDGDQWCICKGPIRSPYQGVRMLVWHKGSKGKFHKLATSYECSEIIPFVKEVRKLKPQEAVA